METTTNCLASIDNLKFSRDFTYENKLMIDFDIEGFLISYYDSYIQEIVNRQLQNQMQNFYNYASTSLFVDALNGYKEAIKNNYPFNGYGAMQKYELTYNKNCILSYYMDEYLYTGGAHGNTTRKSQTFNLKTGRLLTLQDFFKDDYRKIVIPEIKRQAQIMQQQGILFENYNELIMQNFNQNSFYLTDDGIVIYYQQYEIAPYSSGIITFTIPYSMTNLQL